MGNPKAEALTHQGQSLSCGLCKNSNEYSYM